MGAFEKGFALFFIAFAIVFQFLLGLAVLGALVVAILVGIKALA